jgi:hypothetical protein
MESPEGFGREIEEFLSLQRSSVETIKDFPHVCLITFQELSEPGNKLFALLLVCRLNHHQHTIKPHELGRVLLIEPDIALFTPDQAAPAGDKLQMQICICEGQRYYGKAEEEYGLGVHGREMGKKAQGLLLARSQPLR